MLRPSRPMMRPFMSSAGSWTTDTVVSAAWPAARRCMTTERMLRTRRSASRLVSSSTWRTRRRASRGAAGPRRSLSSWLLGLRRRSGPRRARARGCARSRALVELARLARRALRSRVVELAPRALELLLARGRARSSSDARGARAARDGRVVALGAAARRRRSRRRAASPARGARGRGARRAATAATRGRDDRRRQDDRRDPNSIAVSSPRRRPAWRGRRSVSRFVERQTGPRRHERRQHAGGACGRRFRWRLRGCCRSVRPGVRARSVLCRLESSLRR